APTGPTVLDRVPTSMAPPSPPSGRSNLGRRRTPDNSHPGKSSRHPRIFPRSYPNAKPWANLDVPGHVAPGPGAADPPPDPLTRTPPMFDLPDESTRSCPVDGTPCDVLQPDELQPLRLLLVCPDCGRWMVLTGSHRGGDALGTTWRHET